jgi:hypothetical protein
LILSLDAMSYGKAVWEEGLHGSGDCNDPFIEEWIKAFRV